LIDNRATDLNAADGGIGIADVVRIVLLPEALARNDECKDYESSDEDEEKDGESCFLSAIYVLDTINLLRFVRVVQETGKFVGN
jgi:hypothetical protein